MSFNRTLIKTLFLAAQTGLALDEDPSTDGSGYVGVPCEDLSDPPESMTPMPTNYANGSNYPSDPIVGIDGWELSFTTPWGGLLTSPADPAGVADDWLDILLLHVLATRVDLTREAVAAIAAADAAVVQLAAGTSRVAGDPVCIYESGLRRAMWSRVDSVAAPNITIATPLEFALTTAAYSRGVRVYRDLLDGGDTLAFVHDRPGQMRRTLLGGRCTKWSIEIAPNKRIMQKWSFRGDSVVFGGKGSLPSPAMAPAFTAIKGGISPIHVDGESLGHVASISIDMGVKPLLVDSVHGTPNGRGADLIGSLTPTITVDPVSTDATNYENVRAALNGQQVTVQLGSGYGDGDPMNSGAILCDNMGPVKVDQADAGGLARDKIVLTARNPGSGSHYVQVARS